MIARILATLILSALFCTTTMAVELERRMAVSLGAGKARYTIAEVDPATDKIINIIDAGDFDTGFQIDLMISSKRQFSPVMFERTLDVFKRIKSKHEYFGVSRFKAVAAQSFRMATNSRELTDNILRHTGLTIKTLSPKEEDSLDYFTALKASQNPNQPVVWDIGAERFQMIMDDRQNDIFTHKGGIGSESYMNYLLEVVQHKDAKNNRRLHPLTQQEADAGIRFARFLAHQIPAALQQAIKNNQGEVLAIGSLFRYSISGDIAGDQNKVNQDTLRTYINRRLTDEEEQLHRPGNRPNPDSFSHINLANAILVFGIMEELGIRTLNIANRDSTESILEYTPYWR